MSSARRKRVGEEVLGRIAEAIAEISKDNEAPRTKREIERRTGLGHDTVARAFRQDLQEEHPLQINTAFSELVSQTGRRSPTRQQKVDAEQQVLELRQALTEAEHMLDRYAMALYAYHLATQDHPDVTTPDIVPIGRNRSRK